MVKTKDAGASLPLPVTGSVPLAGDIFFGANRGKSYRLASGPDPVIPTIPTGPRGKVALLHVLARKLGIDPNNPRWALPASSRNLPSSAEGSMATPTKSRVTIEMLPED